MIKRKYKINICLLSLLCVIILHNVNYSITIDKMGREIVEIVKPTAESKVDENEISDALRKNVMSELNINDPTKNIISNKTITPYVASKSFIENNVTLIRHTNSIADLDAFNYKTEAINDDAYMRIRLKIEDPEIGIWYANNGFYKLNGKTYYFDKDGLMVIGSARDNMGINYYFSLETGELIKSYK